MTKSETMKKLAAASNAVRLDELGQRIEALRSARIESVEQLAIILEPLALAMAALTDETRETLQVIVQQAKEQAESLKHQVEAAKMELNRATVQAQQAAASLAETSQWMEARQYLLVIATGVTSALLVSAFWLWLAPPTAQNQFDAKAVVEILRREMKAVKP